MANYTIAKQGVLRLPPGFRFHPTDEELVVQYLKRKAFSFALPAAIIPEIDLGKYNPWDLPGGGEQEKYFFHLRVAKYPNGCRTNRAIIGTGYWKASGKDTPIIASKNSELVGMKKVLVFYHGKPPTGFRTDWIMHEYRLADASFFGFGKKKKLVQSTVQTSKDWVLCRIFMKRRTADEDRDGEGTNQEHARVKQLINFMWEQENSQRLSPTSSSSSGLSCVTELFDRNCNGEVSSRLSHLRNDSDGLKR